LDRWREANSFAPQHIWAAAREEAAEGAQPRAQEIMAKTNPFEFLQQVRAEGSKVTWPTRKETMITTAMVFIMAVLASIFFLVVDQVIRWGVSLVLGLGG
jgi:preprotein translocase subunit SecE